MKEDLIKNTEAEQSDLSEKIDADIVSDKGEEFVMPEGSVTSDKIVDDDFWKGITAPDPKPKKKRSLKRKLLVLLLALVFIAVGFGIACVTARGRGFLASFVRGKDNLEFTLPVSDKPAFSDKKDESGRYTVEGLAEVCKPMVVSLCVYTDETPINGSVLGSGVILTSDGYIVTNAHVVANATKGVKVVLDDGTPYAARIVGSDKTADLAVIKIDAKGLTPAEFGNSDDVEIGEEVVTIGSPAGYGNTVSDGVVSGLNRVVELSVNDQQIAPKCIQVDAAINPGNSGGALFNMYGQVIGITASKLTTLDYERIGFAIPTNTAKVIIEQLIEHGKVLDRVKTGITYSNIDIVTAKIYGVQPGLYVEEIETDSDVFSTKLNIGDIITGIDGTDVVDIGDIDSFIQGYNIGDVITCHVYRPLNDETRDLDSKALEFDITFALMEDDGTFVETDSETE